LRTLIQSAANDSFGRHRQKNLHFGEAVAAGCGNAMNVRRTVQGFAKAGCASVMIEDQVALKRSGHTPVKAVVSRDEA